MTSSWKAELLTFLASEVAKARKNAVETDFASQFTISGPSQTGDKYHSVKAAELTEKYLAGLLKLTQEVEDQAVTEVTTAKPVCYVEIVYSDGSNLAFTFTTTAAKLTRYLFISQESPLGSSIVGKKVGEEFSYSIDVGLGQKHFKGTITKLE